MGDAAGAVTGDGDDVGTMTCGMEAGTAVDRASWAWVHAWDAGCMVGHGEQEVRTVWVEGPCCSDARRTYSNGHRDERGQAMAGGLETVGKHYVTFLGMFGWPPNMYLNWSLKFEV